MTSWIALMQQQPAFSSVALAKEDGGGHADDIILHHRESRHINMT
jgi:hypothetical protein